MRNVSYQNLIRKSTDIFGPRLGRLNVTKADKLDESCIIEAPGFLTSTSRGIIPHLTYDHIEQNEAVKSVLVPIESLCVAVSYLRLSTDSLPISLEHTPPLPTIINGHETLRELGGLKSHRNIVIMSLRDPCDIREMPPNGKKFVNAWCVRGVRKVCATFFVITFH